MKININKIKYIKISTVPGNLRFGNIGSDACHISVTTLTTK